MAASKSERSLLNEIRYLTSLISNHKGTGPKHSKSGKKAKFKWNPSKYKHVPNDQAATFNYPRKPTKTCNRPTLSQPPQQPNRTVLNSSLIHHCHPPPSPAYNKSSETTVMLIKTEPILTPPTTSTRVVVKQEPVSSPPTTGSLSGHRHFVAPNRRLVLDLEQPAAVSIPNEVPPTTKITSTGNRRRRKFRRQLSNKKLKMNSVSSKQQYKWQRKSPHVPNISPQHHPTTTSTPITALSKSSVIPPPQTRHQPTAQVALPPNSVSTVRSDLNQKTSFNSKFKWKRRRSMSGTSFKMSLPGVKMNAKKRRKKRVLASHFKNKVWVPPQPETDVILLKTEPPVKPTIDQVIRADQVMEGQVKPVKLVGHEKKTKRGNKQWVVDGLVRRKIPRTKCTSALVSIDGRRYAMDHTGKRLKRLSLSGHQNSINGGRYTTDLTRRKPKRMSSFHQVSSTDPTRRRLRKVSSSTRQISFNSGRFAIDSTGRRLKRLSSLALLTTLGDGRYAMDSSGKRLKRLSTSTHLASLSPAVSGYLGTAMETSFKRMMANRVVKKSKAYVWHARMKKKLKRSEQFCLFYNRFGKCNKGDECPYIHDPDKIAVCTKFLRGACDKMNGTCPFSHKLSKEKMPVCSFFLRGVCTRDDCPYLHVSVGREAEVCPDFIKGYCPNGEKCTLQHVLDCPKFSLTGTCPKGAKCPLRHREKSKKTTQQPPPSLMKEPTAFKKIRWKQEAAANLNSDKEENVEASDEHESTEDTISLTFNNRELNFIPLESNYAPDFIPLL